MVPAATSLPTPLEPGERELWAGRPRGGVVFRATDALLIPFSFLRCGFVVFWESSVLRSNAPGFFVLWGVPFVLAGAYFAVGRFFFDAWRRGRTTYRITSSRVLISSGSVLKSLSLAALSDVTLIERSDGSGTITFGQYMFGGPGVGFGSFSGVPQVPALEL